MRLNFAASGAAAFGVAVAGMLMLAGCATAVADSLDRRGVDARMTFVDRVSDARKDAAEAEAALSAAGAALSASAGLDGAALARQLDAARAASEDAALAAQDFRLAIGSAETAAGRYFDKRTKELELMDAGARAGAEAKLGAQDAAARDFSGAARGAALRLSPALSLLDGEVTALRKNPTSRVAAAARAAETQKAINAAADSARALGGAAASADALIAALNAGD